MSALTTPISPAAFALAIQDLPLAKLHLKAAELRNSNAHLVHSNLQLQPFADEGDEDCADAVRENEQVMRRNEDRIGLLRKEVENRGFRWGEAEVEEKEGERRETGGTPEEGSLGREAGMVNGTRHERPSASVTGSTSMTGSTSVATGRGGRLTDEELRRRLEEREELGEGIDEDGVHL